MVAIVSSKGTGSGFVYCNIKQVPYLFNDKLWHIIIIYNNNNNNFLACLAAAYSVYARLQTIITP